MYVELRTSHERKVISRRCWVIGCWGRYLILSGGSIRGRRRLHVEGHRDLYSSQNIRVIKSRRVRLAGHVAQIVKINSYRVLVGTPEG